MFITLEGIEGSGKTLLLDNLEINFKKAELDYLRTREPGASWIGKRIRPLLLESGNKLTPESELFLFLADRAQHVQDIIRPALANGRLVICDRYIDSTYAYQGYGRDFPRPILARLNELATQNLSPDLTLLLDLPAEDGLARAINRINQSSGPESAEGRFEDETLDFHRRVRRGFLELAEEFPRFVVLDATLPPSRVAEQAWQAILGKRAALETR